MAVFFNGRCACGREVCDFTCITYAAYMSKQNNIGTWQERMKKEPITNADRIRNMDDYDLAIFLENVSCKYADTESWLDWLRQEAKDD